MSLPGGLADNLGKIVGAIGRVFLEEGRADLSVLLSEARVEVQESSFDNWNGGTYGYTVRLYVSARAFARFGDSIEDIEKTLEARVAKFARAYPNENLDAVVIIPSLEGDEALSRLPVHGDATMWRDGYFRLFLSHVSSFKNETSKLAENLAEYGVTGFVAHQDIEPTKEWERELRLALMTCDALACLLTEEFSASKWTDQEVGFAACRGVLVIPIRLGQDPYGFMARYQGYSGVGKASADLARAMVEILAKHPLTRTKMAEALVASFEGANSFSEAKRSVNNLRLVCSWRADLVERVRRATVENNQIENAFGVTQRAEDILSAVAAT